MAKSRKIELVNQFASIAREAHRRHDVTARNQAEKNIYDAAPSVAYAEKVIATLYTGADGSRSPAKLSRGCGGTMDCRRIAILR